MQVVGGLGELTEPSLAILGRQPIRHAHQIGFLADRCLHKTIDRHSGA